MPCIYTSHQPPSPPVWEPPEKKLNNTTWAIAFRSCFPFTCTKASPAEKEVRQLGETVRFSFQNYLVEDKKISKIGEFFKFFFGI
jgi:hypothetical protein